MTRDELIEKLARVEAEHYTGDEGIWRDWVQCMQRTLAAIEAAGLAIVPVVATEEMISVGAKSRKFPRHIYAAMIAARPLAKEGK